jgi:hypothetical protein
MLLLGAGKVFLELWLPMQPFHDRRSNEFTAGNVAGVMDSADNSALAVFMSTSKGCARSGATSAKTNTAAQPKDVSPDGCELPPFRGTSDAGGLSVPQACANRKR